MEHIVLWIRNGKLGSMPKTEDNLDWVKQCLHTSLIQEDIWGTLHLEVYGIDEKKVKELGDRKLQAPYPT